MIQRLFVYGTLGPGKPNEHVLNTIGGTWQEASVKGYLKPQGWGAEMGFPGITVDKDGDEIHGHLFCSEKLHHHWDKLDVFEGDEYLRTVVGVITQDGTEVEAYIYVLNEEKHKII